MIERLLRFLSAACLVLAFCAALLVLATHIILYFSPHALPWTLKSAAPLILIGAAFLCLQFASPRTPIQILLGLGVSAAFILWGCEQFMPNHALASLIDDLVVFLFVLDLAIVIHGHLKSPPLSPGNSLNE